MKKKIVIVVVAFAILALPIAWLIYVNAVQPPLQTPTPNTGAPSSSSLPTQELQTFTVYNSANHPIANASVVLVFHIDNQDPNANSYPSIQGLTDSNGELKVNVPAELMQNFYWWSCTAEGYSNKSAYGTPPNPIVL